MRFGSERLFALARRVAPNPPWSGARLFCLPDDRGACRGVSALVRYAANAIPQSRLEPRGLYRAKQKEPAARSRRGFPTTVDCRLSTRSDHQPVLAAWAIGLVAKTSEDHHW